MGVFLHSLYKKIENINWNDIAIASIKVVVYIIIGRIIIKVLSKFIDGIFNERRLAKMPIDERRANTLSSLLKSILTYLIYFLVFVYIMTDKDIFNKRADAILAGAGVLGLAISFGAQSLVKDVITGFFVIFEDQYAVGDYITTAGVSGFVEEMGLRITRLRDWGGEVHIVPNGQVTQVTNLSRGAMRALVDIGIAYEEEIEKAIEVMEEVCLEVDKLFGDEIIETPVVQGVISFGPSEVVIRIIAKTIPMEQWKIEREIRKRIKAALDAAGIETPYTKRIMVLKSDERGKEFKNDGI